MTASTATSPALSAVPAATRRLRIALVATKSERGGSQTHLRDLAAGLVADCDVHLLCSGRDWLVEQVEPLGVVCHRIDALANSWSPRTAFAALRALHATLCTIDADLIHAHSAKAGALARIAAAWLRRPAVYTVHGFGFKREAPPLQRWGLRLIETLLAPMTTRMICVADNERRLAQQLPIAGKRIDVIRNGTADAGLRADAAAEPARIVKVARMTAPKRHDLLLDALARLRSDSGSAPAVALLGGGPLAPALAARAQRLGLAEVDFVGDVDDVPARLARAQIFVLLSDHEGLPISVIEAMAAGCAIVASDLPGIRELVVPGREALLVDNAPAAIAAALRSLLTQPDRRAALGAAARARYEREFTCDRMVAATRTVYLQALHGVGRRRSG